jgi:hypothetical protein
MSYITGNIFIKDAVTTADPSLPSGNGYQDCGCATCEALNVDCENCPVCSPINSDVAMAMYDSEMGKSDKWSDSPFKIGK